MNRTRKFLFDGLILALSAVFMRTVGVSWNAYVSNRVGAESMGLLSLVMSVYGFAVTFACSGVGFGVTRTISESLGKNDKNGARRSLLVAIFYAVIFGSVAGISLYIGAEYIGTSLLSDERTVKSIKLISISLLPISLSSVFGGYFNAVRRVYKSALTAVFEQFVRMGACILLFGIFLPLGVEGGCIAIVVGGCIAECSSSIWAGIMCLADKRIHLKKVSNASRKIPLMESIKSLTVISIPIAASTYIRSALLTLEHMLIPKALKSNGLSHSAALASYGMLGSMVLPLVLYPASLTSSFASLLIPELSEAKARGDTDHINRAANKALLFTFAFASCVAGVMISYSGQLGRVIYNSTEAGRYIRMLAPIIPIMYLDTVVDCMLKGLGYQVYTMTVNIIDAAISVVGVLIFIPRLGIIGYVVLISLSELINASASYLKLSSVLKLRLSVSSLVIIPTLCSVLACTVTRILYSKLLYLTPENVLGLILHITTVVVLYSAMCSLVHIKPWIKQRTAIA